MGWRGKKQKKACRKGQLCEERTHYSSFLPSFHLQYEVLSQVLPFPVTLWGWPYHHCYILQGQVVCAQLNRTQNFKKQVGVKGSLSPLYHPTVTQLARTYLGIAGQIA